MESKKAHWSFWAICIFGIIWNAMGCINFVMQMNPETLNNYPEAAKSLVETRPAWSTVAFAIAVFGGLLGDVILIMRKAIAVYIFVISLLAIVVTNIHTIQVSTATDILVGSSMSFVLGLFFIWYVSFAKKKAWL